MLRAVADEQISIELTDLDQPFGEGARRMLAVGVGLAAQAVTNEPVSGQITARADGPG
jgi:hypothetical protein